MPNDFTVAVDVDGVIADLHSEWLRIFQFESGISIEPTELESWEFYKDHGLNDTETSHLFEILDRHGLYDNVKPMRGAKKTLDILRRDGWGIYFVTSCISGIMVDEKAGWLQSHGFVSSPDEILRGLPDEMIVTGSKHRINADVLIDDRPWNLESFKGSRLLYSQPHNQNYSSKGVRRVSDWPTILLYLTHFKEYWKNETPVDGRTKGRLLDNKED